MVLYPMTEDNNMSHWIQDNLRIIISIGIVILLVFAIYSYSKRNSHSNVVIDDSQLKDVAIGTEKNSEVNEIIDEIKDEEKQKSTSDTTAMSVGKDTPVQEENSAAVIPDAQETTKNEIAAEQQSTEEPATSQEPEKKSAKDVVQEVIESQSKDGVITVTAVPGDSVTTLARKAVAQHIAQNNITDLTPAHKIYIEDYLRRIQTTQRIHPETSLSFSNTSINDAIMKARTLNDRQLEHLNTYAQHVTGL